MDNGKGHDLSYEIRREICTLSESKNIRKMLTLCSWNGNPAKLDLRAWRVDGERLAPGKGMTLSASEAQALTNALNDYMAKA